MRTIPDLAASILKHAPASGMSGTAVPGLSVIREDRPTVPVPSVYEASLCLIAQGAKRVSLGDHSVVYDSSRYLLVSVDLPLVGHVIEASPNAPYLCCKIDLDMAALADIIIAEGASAPKSYLPVLAVYPCEPDLVDAVCRLAGLLDRPESITALAPLIQREVLYRLLQGPHGPLLRQMSAADNHLSRISRAIATIRQSFHERLRIDDIAQAAGMSASSLHSHFKAITRVTPLEYRKHLRLHEARRLMMAEGSTAGDAGFAVGYESQSQFSREYRRFFGAPPRQDIERLQKADHMELV